MSIDGTQIVRSLQSVRDFHTEVAKLLRFASSAMAEGGWASGKGKACGSGGSKAIDWPRYWLPEDAFQFYRHESEPLRLAYVAVVFDDIKNPAKVPCTFIGAGWLKFIPDGLGATGSYEYEWCRLPLKSDAEFPLDGKWRDIQPNLFDPNDKYQVEQARAMALPLPTIESEADLQTLIIRPLLDDLSNSDAYIGAVTDPPN